MITRRMLVIVAALLCSGNVFAQSNQLRQSASRLTSEAASFADATYNDSGRSFRNTSNVDAVMSAHQFSASAGVFNRMVNDRRRNQDLREAFQVLQNSWRSAYRTEFQGSRGNNIEGLLAQISRELNSGDFGDNYPFPRPRPDGDGPGRSGRMTWSGKVDDDVRIIVRGGTAQVETIGGTPYYDAVTNFTNSLPSRRASVSLVKRRGRGDVFIEQQPSRENDFTAVVRIRDPRGGASDYEFDLNW
ncbi:MAG TPA: hypothetical protein VGW36_00580 [Pyrinomonadaceae bacterium]|nr:hypothetical protein [Pyrinomonadaceae bacterium]